MKARKFILIGSTLTILLVLSIFATSIVASQGPSTVSVYYQPKPPSNSNAYEHPIKSDFYTTFPAETVQTWSGADGSLDRNDLPDAIIPLPTAPDKHAEYSSAITPYQKYTKTATQYYWRWQQSENCYDLTSDWSIITCNELVDKYEALRYTTKACYNQHLPVGHPKRQCYTYEEMIIQAWGYDSWESYVNEEIMFAKISSITYVDEAAQVYVVKSDGSDPVTVMTFECPYRTNYSCEAHPSYTRSDLINLGVTDTALQDSILQFISDYGYADGTHEVADQTAANAAYKEDSAIISAHNSAVNAKERAPEYTACKTECETNYQAAVDKYNEWKAEGKAVKDAYIAEDNAYKAAKASNTEMYVDCTLNGCVISNPIR